MLMAGKTGHSRRCWLASRNVNANSSNSNFNVRNVNSSGSLNNNNLYNVNSDGNENTNSNSNALAPVASIFFRLYINVIYKSKNRNRLCPLLIIV